MNPEKKRLQSPEWKIWGPYLSDRQWGTVREDYSQNGDAWSYFTHDMARSKAYRWGEDGIAGICDNQQLLCFAPAFWNGKDAIIKERLFGLTPLEGNHGEDVKECYYHLDNTPTHSYMKMLYKYPQQSFPYTALINENKKRNLADLEFELADTGVFENDEYFDIEIEYAKKAATIIVVKITIYNRSSLPAMLYVVPQVWLRNTWSWNETTKKPRLYLISDNVIKSEAEKLGDYYILCPNSHEIVFCENETNNNRIYGFDDGLKFSKDGINDYVVNGANTINPDKGGTKAGAIYKINFESLSVESIVIQITTENTPLNEQEIEEILAERKSEANLFYEDLFPAEQSFELKNIQRQALAGLLWSKQTYYFNISQWLKGDPLQPTPPLERLTSRNSNWEHFFANDIILMPDKWEYPWFAAWDTAFHAIPLSLIDPVLAKEQIRLLTHEWYMHPNGQLPGYEWEFSNVNPPLHAWAAWQVYSVDKKNNQNNGDHTFLKSIFNRLMLNFTWWVNREDNEGNNIFQGGFLGLDNIGIFDRNKPLPNGGIIEQSDGTSWMAMYCLQMMRISLELAEEDPVYEDMATKFFEHFMYIAGAMDSMGGSDSGLWDAEDEFYYDQLKFADNGVLKLKIRSLVGLLPLLCVEVIDEDTINKFPEFAERLHWFVEHKPELSSLVSRWNDPGQQNKRIFSILRGHRLKSLLRRMLDSSEFLSEYGIRSLSKFYEVNPFRLSTIADSPEVRYSPAESSITMFGGNSNWRGPVWIPVNYLLIHGLLKFYEYYGDDFVVEFPENSGKNHSLYQVASEIAERLISIYLPDSKGERPVNKLYPKFQHDKFFKDLLLFYEYFDGDSGRGVGASHQTGWTSLLANLISQFKLTYAAS